MDVILLTMIALFGLWVINKHYNNAGDIEVIIKQMASTISDMRKMQDDLIQFRQDLINIDAKYRMKFHNWENAMNQPIQSSESLQEQKKDIFFSKYPELKNMDTIVNSVQDAINVVNDGDKDGDK